MLKPSIPKYNFTNTDAAETSRWSCSTNEDDLSAPALTLPPASTASPRRQRYAPAPRCSSKQRIGKTIEFAEKGTARKPLRVWAWAAWRCSAVSTDIWWISICHPKISQLLNRYLIITNDRPTCTYGYYKSEAKKTQKLKIQASPSDVLITAEKTHALACFIALVWQL